jgi:hypothetical protein
VLMAPRLIAHAEAIRSWFGKERAGIGPAIRNPFEIARLKAHYWDTAVRRRVDIPY